MADGLEGSDRVKVVYRVKQGDTLASIAKLFKTTVSSLQNVEPDSRQLYRGRRSADRLRSRRGSRPQLTNTRDSPSLLRRRNCDQD